MSDPVALVTGGSGGIGRAVCGALLDRGYRVLDLDRRPASDRHPRLRHVEVELSDTGAVAGAARALAREHRVSVLVHCAGAIRPAPLEDVSPADLDYLHALHVRSVLVLVQACLPGLKEAGNGRVVLISSRAALGLATRSAYSATKAALLGLARTWALELAPHGITVNAIAPGPIAGTEMFHEIVPAGSEAMRALAASIPVGRLGTPEDVAHAVGFLAAPEAGFVTGQVLYVCGGSSVGTTVL